MKRVYQTSERLPESEKIKTLNELKLGYLNLKDEMFDQAKINFLLSLQYDSRCADAYWGLMLVKFQIKDEDELASNPILYKSAIYLPECQKALDFANDDQKKIYESLLEHIYKVNEGDNY